MMICPLVWYEGLACVQPWEAGVFSSQPAWSRYSWFVVLRSPYVWVRQAVNEATHNSRSSSQSVKAHRSRDGRSCALSQGRRIYIFGDYMRRPWYRSGWQPRSWSGRARIRDWRREEFDEALSLCLVYTVKSRQTRIECRV